MNDSTGWMTSPSPVGARACHSWQHCVCVCVSVCHFLGENRTGSCSESRQQALASPPQGSLSPQREKERDVCICVCACACVCPSLTPAFILQSAGSRFCVSLLLCAFYLQLNSDLLKKTEKIEVTFSSQLCADSAESGKCPHWSLWHCQSLSFPYTPEQHLRVWHYAHYWPQIRWPQQQEIYENEESKLENEDGDRLHSSPRKLLVFNTLPFTN